MGTRVLVYTCVCTGKVSATCLRRLLDGYTGQVCVCGGGGEMLQLYESEGVQGTHVAAARMGISIDTGMGVGARILSGL